MSKRKTFLPEEAASGTEVELEMPAAPMFSPLRETAQIRSAKDLLILREKRQESLMVSVPGDNFLLTKLPEPKRWPSELCPSFAVGAYVASGEIPEYESRLMEALSFIDSCLSTHDREGNRLGAFAQAHRLRSIGVKLPVHLNMYEYIPERCPEVPSFWGDAANYEQLWKQRRFTEEQE